MTVQVAKVEKVGNGFVVDFGGGVKRVAIDGPMLAGVFSEWPEPPAGLAALEASGVVVRGADLEPAVLPAVEEWPSTLTPRTLTPDPSPDTGEGSVADEVQRVPVADDGFEFPPVKQLGANHFVVQCPSHGEQRMERAGSTWVCPKKTNRADCATRIPREAMSRAIRAA